MLRVSQNMKFTHFVNDMNSSMSKLMEMNIQASSQKKVNKPSDDPVGAARILGYRDSLRSLETYRENIDTAKGWLGTADETLLQVNTVLTRCKELAQQCATGTMSADNREQTSYEIRQLFGQLLNLANTEYEGRHIFAGHKTQQEAFVQGMGMTTNDANIGGSTIQGNSDYTVVVQFLDSGTVGVDALDYRYSNDGGDTWINATLAAGDDTLDLNGVLLTLHDNPTVTAVDPANDHSNDNGTWLWIRPAAIYQGDDSDGVEVDEMCADAALINSTAEGAFGQDIMVRIVSNASGGPLNGGAVTYVYSVDGGANWSPEKTVTGDAASTKLIVPGGYLTLASNSSGAGANLYEGETFFIRPRKAEVKFEISQGEYLTVNNIGKDVFGGLYKDPNSSTYEAAFNGGAKNVFETVANLLAYVETNNQQGIQQCLEDLSVASGHVMTQAATVGGRENRLEVADNILSGQEISQSERLSTIEDADVAELMTQLAQQQIIYETVLKSSSMIMRMNLMNYV